MRFFVRYAAIDIISMEFEHRAVSLRYKSLSHIRSRRKVDNFTLQQLCQPIIPIKTDYNIIISYHIRRLKQVRNFLGPDVAAKLVVSLVFTRLDYCNAILAGLPRSTIAPLQRVQNAAARLVARLGPYNHVSATLKDLHWLPI